MANRRMFVQGDFAYPETPRAAASRLMSRLDEEAARHGMRVAGDVTISVSEQSVFAVAREIRLEADVVTR